MEAQIQGIRIVTTTVEGIEMFQVRKGLDIIYQTYSLAGLATYLLNLSIELKTEARNAACKTA